MMGPLACSYAMIFVNQQIDKIIVSGMEKGTLTAMSYGSVLTNLITTLIGAACSVLFTHMAIRSSNGEHEEASELAMRSCVLLITTLLPITVVTVMCSSDIVQIAFGRGAFDSVAVKNASRALMGYGFCFVPFGLKELFIRFQYGRQDTKTPMINTGIGVSINIFFSVLLSRFLGVFGVTLATSLSEATTGGLNMRSARKKSEYLRFGRLLPYLPAWCTGIALCLLGIRFTKMALADTSITLRFIVTASIGFVGYFVGILPWLYRYKGCILSFLKR